MSITDRENRGTRIGYDQIRVFKMYIIRASRLTVSALFCVSPEAAAQIWNWLVLKQNMSLIHKTYTGQDTPLSFARTVSCGGIAKLPN